MSALNDIAFIATPKYIEPDRMVGILAAMRYLAKKHSHRLKLDISDRGVKLLDCGTHAYDAYSKDILVEVEWKKWDGGGVNGLVVDLFP